jgi:hypothetical protein
MGRKLKIEKKLLHGRNCAEDNKWKRAGDKEGKRDWTKEERISSLLVRD